MAVRAVDFTRAAFSLESLIKEALEESESADPRLIVREILPYIPEDRVWDVVERCLVDRVRQEIRDQRNHAGREPKPSARWASVKADHESGALAIMRLRVAIGTEWKFLGECSRTEVATIASQLHEYAAHNTRRAEKFERLNQVMNDEDVESVSELSPERVKEILS